MRPQISAEPADQRQTGHLEANRDHRVDDPGADQRRPTPGAGAAWKRPEHVAQVGDHVRPQRVQLAEPGQVEDQQGDQERHQGGRQGEGRGQPRPARALRWAGGRRAGGVEPLAAQPGNPSHLADQGQRQRGQAEDERVARGPGTDPKNSTVARTAIATAPTLVIAALLSLDPKH
jgi:hypothetical protein